MSHRDLRDELRTSFDMDQDRLLGEFRISRLEKMNRFVRKSERLTSPRHGGLSIRLLMRKSATVSAGIWSLVSRVLIRRRRCLRKPSSEPILRPAGVKVCDGRGDHSRPRWQWRHQAEVGPPCNAGGVILGWFRRRRNESETDVPVCRQPKPAQ